jgi:hypothetical protein
MEGRLPDPMDMTGVGLDGLVAEMADLFSRSRRARLTATVARESGRPYRVIRDHWTDEDMAAVLGLGVLEAQEALARCPGCGTDPADVMDLETGRPLAHGAVKVYVADCIVCATLADVQEAMTPEHRAAGFQASVRPRGPDDPFLDDGGSLPISRA